MNTTTIPEIFSRYTQEKYDRFKKWITTKHGQTVYTLFRKFSEMYRNAGHDRCGANLIGNRIRWEMIAKPDRRGTVSATAATLFGNPASKALPIAVPVENIFT